MKIFKCNSDDDARNLQKTKTRLWQAMAGLGQICRCLFSRVNGFGGADFCTGTAVGADIGVNFIDVTFGDCLNGAFVDAGAASDAVFINYVCHDNRFYVSDLSGKNNNNHAFGPGV
jgi:hypothetical protein